MKRGLAAQRLDALGQRLIGDRYTPPDLAEKAILGNQLAAFPQHQEQGVEIARVELDRRTIAHQPPLRRIEHEIVEVKAAGRHFSAKPQELLMPLTGESVRMTPHSSMEAT